MKFTTRSDEKTCGEVIHRKPHDVICLMKLSKCGPIAPDDPGIGELCQACKKPLMIGDFTCLIPLGPGDNPERQECAREGRSYNAVAILVHWSCATGQF